jgi:hypothetical protein
MSIFKLWTNKLGMVAHIYNPSYSEGRRIMILRPVLVKVLARPCPKNKIIQ